MTYDVIIIGAGIAGLAAARELCNLGAKVCLLEARPQLGVAQERNLEAMYVHGQGSDSHANPVPNPVYALIKHYGIVPKTPDINKSDLRDTRGEPRSLPKLETELKEYFSAAVFEIQEARNTHYQNPPSVADVLMYHESNIPKRDSPAFWARKLVTTSIIHHTDAKLSELSIIDLQHDRMLQGEDVLIIGGYTQLAESLYHESLETQNLSSYFNSVVKKINHDPKESHVSVETSKGITYNAKAVLCALPFNILKQNQVLFHPALSKRKRDAIQHFKVGHQNTVLLRFKKRFWPADAHYLFPNDPDVDTWPEYLNLNHFITETNSKNTSKNTSGNISENKKEYPALLVFLYGENANFANKTEEEILKMVIMPLKKAYKDAEDFELIEYAISHWDSDKYSQGHNVYCSTGCSSEHIDALNADETGGLFFAGGFKRIKQGMQATVEGAYDSGVEAALEIRSYLKAI